VSNALDGQFVLVTHHQILAQVNGRKGFAQAGIGGVDGLRQA
jgi:hypothetical protein